MNQNHLITLLVSLATAIVIFGLVAAIAKLLSLRRQRAMRLVAKYFGAEERPAKSRLSNAAITANFRVPKSLQNASARIGERMAAWFTGRAVTNRYQLWLAAKLASAGRFGNEPVRILWGNKVVASAIGLLAGFVLFYRGIADGVFAIFIGALAGFLFPDFSLIKLARERTSQIEKQLPDVVDLMRLCLLAGLSFEATTGRISVAIDGPLAEEFGGLNLAIRLGKSRLQALSELLARTESKDLERVIGALMQVERLGVSMNATLTEIAREGRETRRAKLRENGQKVAVKILMPLLFCFLPAMMIIVLGPAMVDLVTVLGSL